MVSIGVPPFSPPVSNKLGMFGCLWIAAIGLGRSVGERQ